jgi:predicted RNase H-like HicB family nuclease
MKRTYLIVFEKTDNGWSAFAPDIPGTGGLGDSFEDARQSLRQGIDYMLEDCIARRLPLPEAKSTGVDFSEFDPNPEQSHYEIEWLTVDIPESPAHPGNSDMQAA